MLFMDVALTPSGASQRDVVREGRKTGWLNV